MIDLILGDLGGYLIAAVVALGALFGWGKLKKIEGRKQSDQLQERIDHEKANEIRRDVDDVKPVQHDKLKFRD